MKNSFLAFYLLSTIAFSQVGINTETPKSTLEVNGSYAGNFKEIDSNKTLDIDDQLINIIGNNNIVITLPDGTDSNFMNGRIYTIKNSSTVNANIKGINDSQLLRIDAGNIIPNLTLNPGASVQIVRNNNTTTNLPLWEIIQFTSTIINNDNNTKSLQYTRSITSPIDSNTPSDSVVEIGNIRVRYNGTSTTNAGFIQYQTLVNTHTTVWYKKAGSGNSMAASYAQRAMTTETWSNLTTSNIAPGNRDVSESIIILHNTKEVYRITTNLNGNINASGNVPAINSSVTLFVERLE